MSTSIQDLTIEQVADKAIEIALANPDHVYERVLLGFDPTGEPLMGCRYLTPEGEGSCLFGQALIALGVSAEQVGGCEGMPISYAFDINDPLVEEMDTAQVRQDAGWTWSTAVHDLAAFRGAQKAQVGE